jgi:FixJ family two-component response regulator
MGMARVSKTDESDDYPPKEAMKGGAIEFLTKPFRDQELLDAVDTGLARDRARRESDKALGALKERFGTLSSREREIMFQVTAGRLNKQIAHDIGIAESTVGPFSS